MGGDLFAIQQIDKIIAWPDWQTWARDQEMAKNTPDSMQRAQELFAAVAASNPHARQRTGKNKTTEPILHGNMIGLDSVQACPGGTLPNPLDPPPAESTRRCQHSSL